MAEMFSSPQLLQMLKTGATGISAGAGMAAAYNNRQTYKSLERNSKHQLLELDANLLTALDLSAERSNRLLGEQRAQIAKSGLDISGSPLRLLGETAHFSDYEQQLLRHNAELARVNLKSQQRQARANKNLSYPAGLLSTGTSLLGNLGQGALMGNLTGGLFNGQSNLS